MEMENGKIEKGKIEMGLWNLPSIGPSILDSACYAESNIWLPGPDSNQRQGG
jgi:hypothetical protein